MQPKSMQRQLKKATEADCITIIKWVKDKPSVDQWGGPDFRYPFDRESFIEDIKLKELASFVLVDEQKKILAFGQYYLRLGLCHLGRLVVKPNIRGQGIGKLLIHLLCEEGKENLKTSRFSLFVLSDNYPAIKLYKKIGFVEVQYPGKIPLDNCNYIVKD